MFAIGESVEEVNKTPRTRCARASTQQTPELSHAFENQWRSHHRADLAPTRILQRTPKAAQIAGSTASPPRARSAASTRKGRDRPPGNAQGRHAQPQAFSGARRTRGGRTTFTPFGASATISNLAKLLDTGYTGHHEDAELGLVNMKGRIYDPSLRQFLSADPYVQFPALSQSWNRYSYVLNNPMNYTDPTGFQSYNDGDGGSGSGGGGGGGSGGGGVGAPPEGPGSGGPGSTGGASSGHDTIFGNDFRKLPPGCAFGVDLPLTCSGSGSGPQASGDPYDDFDPDEALDEIQDWFSYAGYYPGAGAVPDVLNAGIYAARGKLAALSAIVAVPVIGDAIGVGKKLGKAAEKLAAAGAGTAAKKSFFEGTRYTQKVLQQMKKGAGEFHSFPESAAAFEKAGAVRT